MAKKKYKVSSKPKVAAMNEYIYTDLQKTLAKEYKVNRPYKPGKIKKAQQAARTGLKTYQASAAEMARVKYKGPKFSKLPSAANKPLPNVIPKGISSQAVTKATKAAGYGFGNIMNTTSVSKAKFGIKGPTKIVKGIKKSSGDWLGYAEATFESSTESKLPVAKQKIKSQISKKPLYKAGTYSPVNKKALKAASKPLSKTAKAALVARGAKVAAKGISRIIPGVGTALLAKDVYDITKWASKQPIVKKASKTYGTQANKYYKYNR